MTDNMENRTQLILTDKQVIFIANAVTLAIVATRKHPDVQSMHDFVSAMSGVFEAVDMTDGRTVVDTMRTVQTAADAVCERNGFRVETHNPRGLDLDTQDD